MFSIKEKLGFPDPPTQEEVLAALDNKKWRSKSFIGTLIDRERKKIGKLGIDGDGIGAIIIPTKKALTEILDELIDLGLASEERPENLTLKEMQETDDPNLQSAEAMHKQTKDRGTSPLRGPRRDRIFKKGGKGHQAKVKQSKPAPTTPTIEGLITT